jgi:hypothetical protein
VVSGGVMAYLMHAGDKRLQNKTHILIVNGIDRPDGGNTNQK